MRNRCHDASRERTSRVSLSLPPRFLFLLLSLFFLPSFLYFSVFPSRGRCSIKIPREPRPAGNVVGGAHVESSRGIEAEFRSKTRIGEGGGVTRRRRDAFLNSPHSGHRGRRTIPVVPFEGGLERVEWNTEKYICPCKYRLSNDNYAASK